MRRIGIAASKIAKGNIWLYNLSVLGITLLFALFIYLVCGFVIGVAVVAISLIAQNLFRLGNGQTWAEALRTCLILLGVLVGIIAGIAFIKNVKLKV